MIGLRKSLLQLIFSGSYMLRWNDKLRPTELWEIDKQGHKMILAFVLLQEKYAALPQQEYLALAQEVIEGSIFDYLYRCIVTDLKPPVFYRIKNNAEHYRKLTDYALSRLEPITRSLDEAFWQRLCTWHHDTAENNARHILTAAHWFTSRWEFNLLKEMNRPFDDEIGAIEHNFTEKMALCASMQGMQDIQNEKHALGKFANLSGQLRFQTRWTQVPRIPATSVLGHMFIVATYAYFLSLTVNACPARAVNNFFCGLLHDLPELLTRDIISPVKHSVKELGEIIRKYEAEELERRIFAPLRQAGKEMLVANMAYYLGMDTGSEFHETIRKADGTAQRIVSFDALHTQFNDNMHSPKDGRLIKDCDMLAAFLEAHSSIRNGVSSPHLQEAMARLRSDICKQSVPLLQLDTLLADFD